MEEALSKKNVRMIFPCCHWRIKATLFRAAKLFERDKLRANMQSGHSFIWRLDVGLSGLDCSSCWLLVYELVVSVQTDTWLFKVREK